jgi:hypothetical protein
MPSLFECLTNAPLLQELTLEFRIFKGHMLQLQQHRWPKLHSLILCGARTADDSLWTLLKNHASTLRHLGLHDVQLDSRTTRPSELIEKLPGLAALTSVILRNIFVVMKPVAPPSWVERACYFYQWEEGGAYEQAVEDFLLRGGMLPILNKELFDLQHAKEISSSLICSAEISPSAQP